MKLIVCGGRDFGRRKIDGRWKVHFGEARYALRMLEAIIQRLIDDHSITTIMIIHGAAPGADSLAERFVRRVRFGRTKLNIEIGEKAMPANWDYGKAAGPIRNKQMLDLKPNAVVAFPGGRGTAHMMKISRNKNVPVLELGMKGI